MKPPQSFLWHDYETFGANPFADRPAQFAALRTDADLNPIADPVVWYCAPADDVLPHPEACLITGITPQVARREGLIETEFAQRILDEMSQPGTCSAGYNSIRFDDAFTRNLLYRNLRDPYEREYRNGNTRWDLIDLARMCYALRPEGVKWPMHEANRPSFRLEDLSAANGIPHEGAHDALSDVRATIGLARRILSAQPRLFHWALDMRDQEQTAGLLDTVAPKPLLHTSSRIPAERGCTAIVLPLAIVPNRPKAVVVFDLSADPAPLVNEPAGMIHDLVFTAAEDLPDDVDRLPLKVVHINHVPMLAPLATLKGADTARIRLDPERCMEHARQLMPALETVRAKVAEVFGTPYSGPEGRSDPDRMLYSGAFFSRADKHLMSKILQIPPAQLGGHVWSFQDARLPLMLFRYRARNYPDTLSANEVDTWDRDRKSRLVETDDPDYFTVRDFNAAIARAREERRDQPDALRILDRLEAWVTDIGLDKL